MHKPVSSAIIKGQDLKMSRINETSVTKLLF